VSVAGFPQEEGVSARKYGWLMLVGLALGAVGIGVLAALSADVALGGALVIGVILLFASSEYKAEIVVGLYWLSFCVYETIVSGVTITGFFYPFYAAFVFGLVAAAVGRGIRVRASFFWLYFSFLAVVAISFVGFIQAIDFTVIQRVLTYLIGAIAYLQFRSRRGVELVTGTVVLTSATLAVWVIVSAIRGGFAYRGDVNVNENVVSFYVGLGFVAAICASVHALSDRKRRASGVLLLILTGVLAYAMLLLASRGMAIAAGLALIAVVVRMVVQDRRKLLTVVALLVVIGGGMLLPGGEGLVQRFTGERVESGGSRTPIWIAVYDAYRKGDFKELLLGNGFESSKDVVERGFGTLTSTHNAYLEVIYEFGVVGLALFLALHIAPIVVSWRIRGALGLAGFGMTFFLLGANMTSTATDGFIYWIALALVLAIGTWGEGQGAQQHQPRASGWGPARSE